jgi:gag-polyprotein putative aspartyl protease
LRLTPVKIRLQPEYHVITMRHFPALFLATLIPTIIHAESGCPANVKAIPFHNINRHEMILAVSINHAGPFAFLLDTGTQMTVVDQALAAELNLRSTGKADVAGVSFKGAARFAQLDTLEVGDHLVAEQGVLVYDMSSVQDAGFGVRGLLGEDFLSRYDVLINNTHKVLCIDDTGAMRGGMNGEHVVRNSHGGAARTDQSNVAERASDGRLSTR